MVYPGWYSTGRVGRRCCTQVYPAQTTLPRVLLFPRRFTGPSVQTRKSDKGDKSAKSDESGNVTGPLLDYFWTRFCHIPVGQGFILDPLLRSSIPSPLRTFTSLLSALRNSGVQERHFCQEYHPRRRTRMTTFAHFLPQTWTRHG